MKALIIPIKPYWFYLIAKGDKTVEIRKEALYKAIKKLIDEYGQAIIYFYISKNGGYLYPTYDSAGEGSATITFIDGYVFEEQKNKERFDCVNGKVVARFWCDKVEEIEIFNDNLSGYSDDYECGYQTESMCSYELYAKSCLKEDKIDNYLKGKNGCAIHISYLQIFDRPKELSEFQRLKKLPSCTRCLFRNSNCDLKNYLRCYEHTCYELVKIDKAPMTYYYVEVDG